MDEEVKTSARMYLIKSIDKLLGDMAERGCLGDHIYHTNISAQMADAAICVLQSAVESQAYAETQKG